MPAGPSVPWFGALLIGRVGTDAVLRGRLDRDRPCEVT